MLLRRLARAPSRGPPRRQCSTECKAHGKAGLQSGQSAHGGCRCNSGRKPNAKKVYSGIAKSVLTWVMRVIRRRTSTSKSRVVLRSTTRQLSLTSGERWSSELPAPNSRAPWCIRGYDPNTILISSRDWHDHSDRADTNWRRFTHRSGGRINCGVARPSSLCSARGNFLFRLARFVCGS